MTSRQLLVAALVVGTTSCASAPPRVAPPMALLESITPLSRASARHLSEVALRATAATAIVPIPLTLASGGPARGAVYQQFHLAALAVRRARARGESVESRPLGGGVADLPFAVVVTAFPIPCGTGMVAPIDVRLSNTVADRARAATRIEPATRDAGRIAQLLPGERLPAGSLAGLFEPVGLQDATVEIDYANARCPEASRTLVFQIRPSRNREVLPPVTAVLPASLSANPSPITVQVMLTVDVDGQILFPSAVSGPVALAAAAQDAVRGIRIEPERLNGVAVPSVRQPQVIFTATGEPPAPRPRGGVQASPAVMEEVRARVAREREGLVAMALERAVQAAPLNPDGSTSHGFAFVGDMFARLEARRLAASGLAPSEIASRPLPFGTLVVAAPLTCRDRSIPPIALTATQSPPARGLAPPERQLSGRELRAEFAEVDAPDDALAGIFTRGLLSSAVIEITYAEPVCLGVPTKFSASLRMSGGQFIGGRPTLPFPDGVTDLPSPSTVGVSMTFDEEGRVRDVSSLRGPDQLLEAASRTARAYRIEPRRVNGVAVPLIGVAFSIAFTATGDALSPSPNSFAAVSVATPGLTAATSRCPIATDAEYGVTPGRPIAIGGDDWAGVQRQRAFLDALRGPEGQAVSYRFAGARYVAASRTFLDMYSVTYVGQPQAVRVYVDQYHTGPLQAPQGFTCAVALPTARPPEP